MNRLRSDRRFAPLHPQGTARQRLAPAPVLPPAAAALLAEADLGEEAAFVAWQVGEWAGGAKPAAREALVTAVAGSLAAVAQGSTRVPLVPAAARALAELGELVGPPGGRTPFIVEGGYLYQQRHHAAETRIAAAIARRRGAPARIDEAAVAAALAEVRSTAVPEPSEDQLAAVSAALAQSLAVITGGPGTGKTTIVLTLVRTLVRLGLPPEAIALAAPTGKAANRLDEAMKAGLAALAGEGRVSSPADRALAERPPAARTLHRLLGYSPSARAFAHQAGSPLPERVVIVDESSMIDLQLMDRLLDAVAPDAALVLLGDADQLPSVDAGAVFRDLAPAGVRLTQSHRLRGRPDAAAVDFAALDLVPPADREELLERWYTDKIAALPDFQARSTEVLSLGEAGFSDEDSAHLDQLFAHHQSHRLLAVTRGRPTGAEALNAWMHRRFGDGAGAFHPGEPIMMLRNDYDRALWNGDQGLVIRVREPRRAPRLAAVFKPRGQWTAWHLDSLGDSLSLAFALTVHKAQGSEYDDVALILPDVPLPLLTRELLYTAVTRSRRSLVVCGAPAVLAAGAARPTQRSTGIAGSLSPPR